MKMYNVKEIADLLGTNPETVRRWIRGGRLGADQESRKGGNTISEEELEEFLAKNPKYANLAGRSNLHTVKLEKGPEKKTVRKDTEMESRNKPIPKTIARNDTASNSQIHSAKAMEPDARIALLKSDLNKILAFSEKEKAKYDQLLEKEMMMKIKKQAAARLLEEIDTLGQEITALLDQIM